MSARSTSLLSRLAIGLSLLFALPAQAQSYDRVEFSLKSQLELVEAWLPGNFDNSEQIVQQSGGGFGAPVYTPLMRLHFLIEKAEMPGLGDAVFYLRAHKNDAAEDLVAQGLLSVRIDREASALRAAIYRPDAMLPAIAAAADLPDTAAQWQRSDAACDLLLRYEGTQMVGQTASKTCQGAAISDPARQAGRVMREIHLSDGSLWLRERVQSKSGRKELFATPADGPGFVQMRRADWYNCIVMHNPDGNMAKTQPLTQVRLHSQGGTALLDWPDGRRLLMNIQTREFWTPTDNRSLMLRVLEAGNPVPLAYSYSVIPTRRMGLNVGWFYTRCAIASEEVF